MNFSENKNASFLWNSSTNNNNYDLEYSRYLEKAVSSIALVIITLGLVGNTSAFLIFRLHNDMKKMPSMVYLSFMCITDTIALFTWNLDHFLKPNFKFSIESINIYTCHFFTFIQYFSLESSSWLLTWLTIDRYVTILSLPGSFAIRLPFGTFKSSIIWSCFIISFFACFNSFLLFHGRKKIYSTRLVQTENNASTSVPIEIGFRCYELDSDFKIYLEWQNVHLVFYELIPFILMIIFNSLLVRTTFFLFNNKQSNKYHQNGHHMIRHKKMKHLTISLIILTIIFIILTLPATILYNYFYNFFRSTPTLILIITLIDYLTYLNHSTLFINCLISNLKFRSIFFKIISDFFISIKKSVIKRKLIK